MRANLFNAFGNALLVAVSWTMSLLKETGTEAFVMLDYFLNRLKLLFLACQFCNVVRRKCLKKLTIFPS